MIDADDRRDVFREPLGQPVRDAASRLQQKAPGRTQRLYPVVDASGSLCGVATRDALDDLIAHAGAGRVPGGPCGDTPICASVVREPCVTFVDEPLARVAFRMAETGCTCLPVLERGAARRVVGIVSLADLLRARSRVLEEERVRERVIRLRWLLPRRGSRQPRGEEGASTAPATPTGT